jgi:hypothetical protein
MAGDRDFARSGINLDHPVPRGGALLVTLELFRVPAPQRADRGAPVRLAGGVPVIAGLMMGVVLMILMVMMVTMCGLSRDRNGQKNGGRSEESHHRYLFAFVMG